MSIAENIQKYREILGENVKLVAVSKTKPLEALEEAYAAGQRIFGENKIQEMVSKCEQLPNDIEWHMIGHVQTNKIKYMAPMVAMVHGVDREKVLKELNKQAAKCDRVIDCLLQVHIAQEQTKFGFDAAEVEALVVRLEQYPNVRVRGLMGMATNTDDATVVEQEFAALNDLFLKFEEEKGWDVLSMGMSGDYDIAIEEGSNMVRIGSSIFGSR